MELEGQELADVLQKRWRNVKYDSKTGRGSAEMGHLMVRWEESQNDPAVWISIQQKGREKCFDMAEAAKAMEQINKILSDLG
jgi:hypothetical protein